MSDTRTLPILLEVGCEEVPARFLTQAERDFGERLRAALEEARLFGQEPGVRNQESESATSELRTPDSNTCSDSRLPTPDSRIRTYSTPRRLIAHVPAVLERQLDRIEEIIGPPVKVALDKDGKPTRAAESFAAKNEAKIDDLYRVTTPKGEYLAVKRTTHGRPAIQVLGEILPDVITGLTFPKSMCWERTKTRWVRPIRWILALLGEGDEARVIPFEVAGVKSDHVIHGHRTFEIRNSKLETGIENFEFRVSSFQDYAAKLRRMGVEFDPAKRRERVQDQLKVSLAEISSQPSALSRDRQSSIVDRQSPLSRVIPDPDLEEWVVNSTEHPRALAGTFEKRFLKLPREILITVMRDHQHYFAVEDARANLQARFITFLNRGLGGPTPDPRLPTPADFIRRGHERVLTARFTDAEFFWNADQKIPLRDRMPMLERVTYQAKLGSYGDRVRRMETIAKELCKALPDQGQLTDEQEQHALRAVQLCKSDLTTQMVQELTELQGVVGGLYAAAQGEPKEVADAIYDHYRPAGAEDSCPRSVAGAVVSLADKLDSVVAGFAAGLGPTGSSDPFALRRAGNGIIKLAVEALAGLDLTILTNRFLYSPQAHQGAQAVLGNSAMGQNIDNFLRERMEFYFREATGLRHDTVRAVLKPTRILQDLVPSNALSRARALERVRDTEDFLVLAAAAKRTRNIRKSASVLDIVSGTPDSTLFTEAPERELYEAYRSLSQRIERLSDNGDFEEAFRVMSTIRLLVDRFFDSVLVMTEDTAVRRNRLTLLLRLNEDVFTSLADLAEIAVDSRSAPEAAR